MEASSKWEVYRCPVTNRHYDPFRVLSSLRYFSKGNFNELVKSQEKPEVALQLAELGRRSFGLSSVNPETGEGTPDAVVLAMIEEFTRYVQGKGEGAGNWRKYARPLAYPPSSAPKNCSDCG